MVLINTILCSHGRSIVCIWTFHHIGHRQLRHLFTVILLIFQNKKKNNKSLSTLVIPPLMLLSRSSAAPKFHLELQNIYSWRPRQTNYSSENPPSSSLGLLGVLPIELLRLVLNSSDFQRLSRFARVCHQAKTLVESLLSYQDIMKHAFTALFALSLSKLITFHTAATNRTTY